ncbi:MAG: NUDIX domain-containing protein [candidate division NC10 bacterium]|nr:NUDIX domain-containing protein [candidate division NC10 bacterium]
MGREISAGVILVRNQPQREYLLLDYGSHWDFPKGHIEPGEDPQTTAARELQEETGIRDARFVPGFKESMRYFYRKAGEGMLKAVIFFLAETPTGEVTLSPEHSGYLWLPYEEAVKRLTFKNARELLAKAQAFLDTRRPGVA